MDCKYFVKVKPIARIEKNGNDCWSINEYHNWLKENQIDRYRGGNWPTTEERYNGEEILFRFESKEDAMAFKLRWV